MPLVRYRAKYLLLMLCLGFASVCQAIGFGDLKVYSYLSEPLIAEIELTGFKDMDTNLLKVNLADAKDFVRAGIDRPYFLTYLVFETLKYNDKLFIVIRTSKPVQTPYLEFLVELSWPDGNLIKDYTILLDPPPANSAADRPLSNSQLAEKAAQSKTFGENTVESQIDMQKAKQQKATAEASLADVVRQAPNKFSDDTFDLAKTPLVPGVVPEVLDEEQANKAAQEAYNAQLQNFKKKEQQKANVQANKVTSGVLHNVVADLENLRTNVADTISVNQILEEEKKEEEHIDFNQVIKPVINARAEATVQPQEVANAHDAIRSGKVMPVVSAEPSVPNPPTGSNHLYLGLILSLLLIAAGIGVAMKRGLHKSIMPKHDTVVETKVVPNGKVITTEVDEVPFTDHPDDKLFDDAAADFTPIEDDDAEHIELSSPTDVDLDKFEEEFEKINLDDLGTPPPSPTAATTTTNIPPGLDAFTAALTAPVVEVTPPTLVAESTSEPATKAESEQEATTLVAPAEDPVSSAEITTADLNTIEPIYDTPEAAQELGPETMLEQAPETIYAPRPQAEPAAQSTSDIAATSTPGSDSETEIALEPMPTEQPEADDHLVETELQVMPESESKPLPEPEPAPAPEPKTSHELKLAEESNADAAYTGPTMAAESKPEQPAEINFGQSNLKLSAEGATLVANQDNEGILDNSDAMSLKIDLAKQYLATGDKESAKDLLREVIEVANDEQKLEAQILLSTII